MSSTLDSEAIENLKQYLRIPSVQPNCDYNGCIEFLSTQAIRIGLPLAVYEVAYRKPVVVLSWTGSQPEVRSVLLSSHMDVVPVYPAMWTHDPFGAEEDEEGNIWARGAQDMKSVGVQYLETVHRLKIQGFKPKRTIHICFTPDEEIGSELGMKLFVETDAFSKLNIGCVLDEGAASTDESFHLFYGERPAYSVKIICSGTPGHGCLLYENTAGEKLSIVLEKFMERRAEEKMKLKNENLNLGDVTTFNLTMLEGGIHNNVVPPELKAVFDCRLSVHLDSEEFEKWVKDVCQQAGEGVHVDYMYKNKSIPVTKLDEDNPWWTALKTQFDEMEMKVNPCICAGATDCRFIRYLGVPAFGFSPMNNTLVKMHDHDEFLNAKIFLKGIDIYSKLISALANV